MTNKSASNSSAAKKVLRIGVIQSGKLVEERRLRKRETVSFGKKNGAMFQITADHLPDEMKLFEYTGGKYYLRFSEDMDGQVKTGSGGYVSLRKLREDSSTQKKGNFFVTEISDETQGKILFGTDPKEQVRIMFNFVAPPSKPGRDDLPLELRGSLISTLDLQFASILIAVTLCTVSFVAYAGQQTYVEPTSIEQISERYQKLIMPDREPEPPRDPVKAPEEDKGKEEEAQAKKKDKPKKDKKKKDKKKVANKSKSKGKAKPVDKEAAARARKAAITKKVAGKGLLGVIGVKSSGGQAGALADVFRDGGDEDGSLGDAMSGIQGVDIAEDGSSATRGGGAGEATGIGDMGTAGGGSVQTGNKVETKVSGRVDTQAPEVDGELSPNKVQKAMKRYISGVRDCYERALKRNPKLSGKIVIGFEILESGKVAEFDFPTDNVGSDEVRSCIKKRSRTWRFPKPDGGAVYVEFPLVFEPSN